MSWLFGTGLGINFNFWALSIALWVITEVLQNYNSKTVRYLSGFVGIAVMSVFGIFPDQVILNFSEYWWVVLFWLPALILDEKSPVKKNYFPWYWAGVGFYIAAFAIWLQGYPGTALCNPDSIFQPHGIWHILSACATLSFFFFFRSTQKI